MALQINAGYWQEASVPPHRDLSTGLLECPHKMAAGASAPRESKAPTVISLVSHPWKSHFPHLLLITQVSSIQCRRGLDKGVNTGVPGSPLGGWLPLRLCSYFLKLAHSFPKYPITHGLLFLLLRIFAQMSLFQSDQTKLQLFLPPHKIP